MDEIPSICAEEGSLHEMSRGGRGGAQEKAGIEERKGVRDR